jgi:60 kDa SS-A/Ro ribonucleoprotein
MKTNRSQHSPSVVTHEGGPAIRLNPINELRRSCLTALLFEDLFYEKGTGHAERVAELIPKCKPEDVVSLAIDCRSKMYLRHMPLFLLRELARIKGNGPFVATGLDVCIQRPDELTEYLALYWKDDKDQPLSAGSKRGLARAFKKFNAETLAKYDQDHAVKLRDVLRLVHAKPDHPEQGKMWGLVIKRELPTPDTWEVALSAGGDKREVFERLLTEQKLGGLAFLRNLRNMIGANVSTTLIRERFKGKFGKVLPFRFVAALPYAPQFAAELEQAMMRCLDELPRLTGTTAIVIDVSGSMNDRLSVQSDLSRLSAASALAVLVAGVSEHVRVFTFSDTLVEVPAYKGLALINTIDHSQAHRNTYLGRAVTAMNNMTFDRLIVITDEQTADRVPEPTCSRAYMINVAPYQNGVAFGAWQKISGWSERVVDFIQALEDTNAR